jgi:hypothetical protein
MGRWMWRGLVSLMCWWSVVVEAVVLAKAAAVVVVVHLYPMSI